MTNPETLWNALASVPARAPEDTLLKNFRATLEDGWDKFDKAVPPAGKTGFLRSEDYVLVKQEYESAKKMLNEIKNDDDLRANIPMRQKLDETIKMLRKHNAESDKNEWYNKALVEMERNLAKLQQDVEMNNTVLPPVTVAAVWWAIATGAIDTMNQSMRDSAKSLETEINTIKKNPIKKIAEFFGFTETSIIADYKEALAEKKAGGFDGVFAGLKIWFYGFLAKLTGTDIAKSLSPEERKLAGFREPVVSQKPTEPIKEQAETVKKGLSNEAYRVTTGFLIRGTNQVRYNNVITSIYAGVRDATWWQDETEKKQMIENEAITLLSSDGSKLRSISYSDLSKKSESDILALVWHGSALSLRKSAIELIQKMLWENKWVFEKIFSDIPEWDKMPLDKIIGILYREKWYQNISQMHTRLESLKITDIGDIPKNLFLDLSWKDGNLVIGDGIFSSRYDAMKSAGLTPGLIKKLHINNETAEIPVSQFRWNISAIWNDAEQKFADNFSNPDNFLTPLQASLKQKFGYSDSLVAELSPSKLKVRDLFDMYVITGGKTSIDQLNIWEKNLLLTKLQAYFIVKNPEEHGKYIATILQSPDKYPEVIQALELISSMVNRGAYKTSLLAAWVGDKIINGVLWFFDIDTKSEKAVAITASIWVIWLAMKLLPVGRLISFITLILASLGIAWFATAQQGVKK